MTLHRPSNVDHQPALSAIMDELRKLSHAMPIIFPMHPRTRKMLAEFTLKCESHGYLRIVEPVGYHDSLCLAKNARLVITDSGGLQEETTYFRVPCLTLRPNTERPVTITAGSNRLSSPQRLWHDIQQVLTQNGPVGRVPPLWDGRTANRIVEAILAHSAEA